MKGSTGILRSVLTITLVGYNLLAREIEVNDEHSAVIASQSSNSYVGIKAFMYMTDTPEKVARKSEEQDRVHYSPSMARGRQTNIYTTSNPKLRM